MLSTSNATACETLKPCFKPSSHRPACARLRARRGGMQAALTSALRSTRNTVSEGSSRAPAGSDACETPSCGFAALHSIFRDHSPDLVARPALPPCTELVPALSSASLWHSDDTDASREAGQTIHAGRRGVACQTMSVLVTRGLRATRSDCGTENFRCESMTRKRLQTANYVRTGVLLRSSRRTGPGRILTFSILSIAYNSGSCMCNLKYHKGIHPTVAPAFAIRSSDR